MEESDLEHSRLEGLLIGNGRVETQQHLGEGSRGASGADTARGGEFRWWWCCGDGRSDTADGRMAGKGGWLGLGIGPEEGRGESAWALVVLRMRLYREKLPS